jgi:hypothetical protein
MLKKFDSFCENIILEGRNSDDKKKFKVDIETARNHINDIGNKYHHYVHDKGHFGALLDELNPNDIYTPKTFIQHIKSAMKGKGKGQISDGYAKILYTFLNDRVNSPFKEYKETEDKKDNQPEGDYDKELENDGGYSENFPDDLGVD